MTVLSYIDDFGGVATDQATHFTNLRSLLAKLGIREAVHKASPPFQVMVWLSLQFDTVAMTVSLPQDKLAEIQLLVHHWSSKPAVTLWDLRTLLGKLLYVSQVCPPVSQQNARYPQALSGTRLLHSLPRVPQGCRLV